jgi:hypothetical protein
MGAPSSRMQAVDQPSAEGLLTAFKSIDSAERQRHAHVLSYWLSIRGEKEFPPLHDLDPLEISDAGPSSVLLELISGGHDAEIRHLGEALRDEGWPEQIMDAANPSVLASIAKKLPIVAISRDFLAFEDEYTTLEGTTRCWVTLLPLSGGGAWVDYVYALVTLDTSKAKAGKAADKPAKKTEAKGPAPEPVEEVIPEEPVADEASAEELVAEEPAAEEPVVEAAPEPELEPVAADIPPDPEPLDQLELVEEAEETVAPVAEDVQEPTAASEEAAPPEPAEEEKEPVAAAIAKAAPGFSKLFDSLAGLTGFYAQGVKVDPVSTEPKASPKKGKAEEHVAEEAEAEPKAEESAQTAEAEKESAEEPAMELTEKAPAKAAPKQPTRASEGILQSKLQEVRAKADEARQARLRANVALYEGLGAAYDFALDAEDNAEEYLKLVEAKGLKIQLRSPMTPVVKLAFDGLCDDNAIAQLEAVLAWALAEDLPRGSLAERIEAAGGIGPILSGESAAN